jgi:hypothetical protein
MIGQLLQASPAATGKHQRERAADQLDGFRRA